MRISIDVARGFVGLAGLATLLVATVAGRTNADERPNILFAFADDWGRYASVYAKIDGPGTVNDVFELSLIHI